MAFDEEMKRLEINDAAARLLSCQTSLKGLTQKQIRDQCPPLDIIGEMIEEHCEGNIFRLESKTTAGNL